MREILLVNFPFAVKACEIMAVPLTDNIRGIPPPHPTGVFTLGQAHVNMEKLCSAVSCWPSRGGNLSKVLRPSMKKFRRFRRELRHINLFLITDVTKKQSSLPAPSLAT
jgi:hypothetical protein